MSTAQQLRRHSAHRPDERFQLLMESVKDYAIFLLDTDGRVSCWSFAAEKLMGFSEDQIIGQHFRRFFSLEDIECGVPERELKKARDEGRARDDRWHVREDGLRFWASGIVTPLHDGAFRGYAVVMRDLTEQKLAHDVLRDSEERHRALAAELEAANQRKDKFLAMLSHELRNPLASILIAVQVMRQDKTTNTLQAQARNIVERQVRQLARLIDDLLEVSRVTAGKIKFQRETVELQILLQRAAETANPLIESRRHQLSLNLPDQPLWTHGDPTRLEQVVVNLLTNAAKYTPDGGKICLALHRQDDHAVIGVIDTGVGIAPELLPRIFDLFTQAELGLDRSAGGLGIGLALVKALVEMHDGKVEARSDGPGRGSQFIVHLPLQKAPKSMETDGETLNASSPASLRLLIVDDNLDSADCLAMLLRMDGHEVQVAYTGSTAVAMATSYQPQVILLDIGLPDLNGYVVAQRLRAQPQTQNATIIALTGYGQESDKEKAAKAGFDHHLTKPVDPTQLQNLLALLKERP